MARADIGRASPQPTLPPAAPDPFVDSLAAQSGLANDAAGAGRLAGKTGGG